MNKETKTVVDALKAYIAKLDDAGNADELEVLHDELIEIEDDVSDKISAFEDG